MTAAEALTVAVARLRSAEVPDPARDARRLLAHALEVPPEKVTVLLRDPVAIDALRRLEAAVARRMERVPVAQIVGWREFYGRRFEVTPDVLDPRPETETLVALALQQPFRSILDLGTGTGCILVSCLAERPGARGLGVDVSAAAIGVAQRNAARLGLAGRAGFLRSDWFAAVDGRFDLVVSNPPYIAADEMSGLAPEIAHEPPLALTPGGDGLDAYRRIAAGALQHLKPGGALLVEIGPAQRPAVAAIFRAAGLTGIGCHRDLDGRDRVVEARGKPR